MAEADGEVVGTAGGYVVGPTDNVDGERFGFIEFLVVDERYRRRGIGKALLEELVARLALKGISEIYLEVDPRNEAAMKLYSSLGFSVSYVTMRLDASQLKARPTPSGLPRRRDLKVASEPARARAPQCICCTC